MGLVGHLFRVWGDRQFRVDQEVAHQAEVRASVSPLRLLEKKFAELQGKEEK